jgi:23S rRNA pseudouridine1911/1915/1917 synthase
MKLFDKDIIYLDRQVLVVKKPRGVPTQPCEDHKQCLEDLAKEYLREHLKKDAIFLHAIYRIDTNVAGLVVFGRSSKALSRLSRQMREDKIHKEYTAHTERLPPHKEGTLRHFHEKINQKAFLSKEPFEGGKEAVLFYKVVKTSPPELLIQLITGRYHQIRAQLAEIGCPIIGDSKYGKGDPAPIQLCCTKIEFLHPIENTPLSFTIAFY